MCGRTAAVSMLMYWRCCRKPSREPSRITLYRDSTGQEIFKIRPYRSTFSNKTLTCSKLENVWQDGQAAGTHIAMWAGTPERQIEKRERMAGKNASLLLHLVANRLEETLWFGFCWKIWIDPYNSCSRYYYSWTNNPPCPFKMWLINMPHRRMRSESPCDRECHSTCVFVWPYKRRLFEARWTAYQTGEIVLLPARLSLPESSCALTWFSLTCSSGALRGISKHQITRLVQLAGLTRNASGYQCLSTPTTALLYW